MSDNSMYGKASKRHLKVYRGHYLRKHRRIFIPHPVIRLSGLYLVNLNFQIGDTIEICAEYGVITIIKVNPENA